MTKKKFYNDFYTAHTEYVWITRTCSSRKIYVIKILKKIQEGNKITRTCSSRKVYAIKIWKKIHEGNKTPVKFSMLNWKFRYFLSIFPLLNLVRLKFIVKVVLHSKCIYLKHLIEVLCQSPVISVNSFTLERMDRIWQYLIFSKIWPVCFKNLTRDCELATNPDLLYFCM